MADQYVRKLFATVTGLSRPTLAIYPALAGDGGGGKTLVPGAGAWGDWLEIIAIGDITEQFWILSLLCDTSAGAHGLREIQLRDEVSEDLLFECRVDATAATVNIPPVKMPIPIWRGPNDGIEGRAGAGAAADEINVRLLVATGL